MRYFLIGLWLLLGLGYYLLAKNCEKNLKALEEVNIPIVVSPEETPCPQIDAYAFERGSADLIKTENWESFRNSFLAELTNDKKIQIVGLELSGEEKGLGMERANAIAIAMGVPGEKLQIYSSNVEEPTINVDCRIPGARIKLVTVTEKIKEIQDRTLIYFPYNSTKKLNDQEVEHYLDAVAIKVLKTNKQIRLTGHTDNKGNPDYNLSLGLSRAEVIKTYLLSQAVPSERIITTSKGEADPISNNNTEQGRAQNRRTELEIIN